MNSSIVGGGLRKILAVGVAMGLVSLSLGLRCGGAADLNPDQCCAANPACQGKSGVAARTCCEHQAKSGPGVLKSTPVLAWMASFLDSPAAAAPHSAPDVILTPTRAGLHDAPLKFPPRDPVKLKTSLLI